VKTGSTVAAVVLVALLCAVSLAAQSGPAGYSVVESGTVPLRAYVGDTVELRVRLRLDAQVMRTLEAPKKLPSASWLEVRQVRVSLLGGREWEVRILYVSFAPGQAALPPLDLRAITLAALQVHTASILAERKLERPAPPREQLALPGTARRLALAVLAAVAGPAAAIFAGVRAVRLAKRLAARRRASLPGSRFRRALRRLRGQLDSLGPRRFYIELTAALRAYIEARHGVRASAATTRELRSGLAALSGHAATGAPTQALEDLARLLERGDVVKFGGEAAGGAGPAELAEAADRAESCVQGLEAAAGND
jgi:hypothetical protein